MRKDYAQTGSATSTAQGAALQGTRSNPCTQAQAQENISVPID